jgi:hypothetical protein
MPDKAIIAGLPYTAQQLITIFHINTFNNNSNETIKITDSSNDCNLPLHMQLWANTHREGFIG